MTKGASITFGRLHTWTLTFYYNRATDTLYIRSPWNLPGAWIDLPDGVKVKVNADTGDALEFEVKDLARGFLSKRPDVARAWSQVTPSPIALRRMENTPFIDLFLAHVQQLISNHTREVKPGNGQVAVQPGVARGATP